MRDYLDFEKPLKELEARIEKLSGTSKPRPSSQEEIRKLNVRLAEIEKDLYQHLTPWQRTQVARHLQRPSALDYIGALCSEFMEFHGDRAFGDDKAVLGGFGRMDGRSVMFIGSQKGKTLKERLQRNFGMPNPEGYRKALRLMKLAEKFRRPVVTFIDTPGAYPGIGAEERGQSEAIARNIQSMSRLQTPIISVIIGEGGSGGALALGVADRVIMLEHAIYSVISPEGCAAILWNDPAKTPDAASALKMTAHDLLELQVIDDALPEPLGGAHRDFPAMAATVGKSLTTHLSELTGLSMKKLLLAREQKYRSMGSLGMTSPKDK